MFLHGISIGDLHLDKLRKLFPDNHLQLQIHELNKACEFAINKGIRHVFLEGDICEYARLSYEAIDVLIRFFDKWDTKLNFYLILGNHDFAEDGIHSLQPFLTMYQLKWFKTIHIFDAATQMVIDGVTVNFLPYPHTKPLPSKLEAINVGHFEVKGSLRDNGRKIKEGIETKATWIMGHLHTPQVVGSVHYSGTLYQLNFGESLPKGFIEFKFRYKNGKLEKQIKQIPNDPRFKLFNIVVESKADLRKVTENPLYLYKLFVKTNIVIPESFLAKHPNIVNWDGFKTKEELDILIDESFLDSNEEGLLEFSVHEGLTEYLQSKKASQVQIKRALEIMQTVKASV